MRTHPEPGMLEAADAYPTPLMPDTDPGDDEGVELPTDVRP